MFTDVHRCTSRVTQSGGSRLSPMRNLRLLSAQRRSPLRITRCGTPINVLIDGLVAVMPILDITPLGSARSGSAGAVAAIVDYLTRSPRHGVGIDGTVGYFADRPEQPGIWRGRGVNGEHLSGEATPEQLSHLLLGGHPNSGAVLVSSIGSAGRAARDRSTPLVATASTQRLDVGQAADRLGVDRSYVKRLLLATERQELDPTNQPAPIQPLHGVREGAGRWRVDSSEVERFIRARTEPKVVVAYDATFKWEKSISVAWVQADPETRRIIEEALDVGVRTGIAYLETHGLEVRSGERPIAADGMWAVQYRHTTNRNLEPQLHDHVVIANIAADPDGNTKTIAARSLFTHATTAGHLAGQAVRHHLTAHLGYEWGPLRNGTCDLAHIQQTPLTVMSTRSREVRDLAETFGSDSQQARRIAALATRQRKQEPADYEALKAKWSDTLTYWGFSPDHERALHGRAHTAEFRHADALKLYAHLDSPAGVTKSRGWFDHDDVIRAVIEWDGHHGGAARISAREVEDVTTRWLGSDAVVRLDDAGSRSPRYSTVAMLRIETQVLDAYRQGMGMATRRVDNVTVRAEQLLWQRTTGFTLGADQAAFVRHLVTSPDRFGLGVGPAGTGKTASLAVACRAWEAAGYRPIGATVTGAATDVLADACGISTRTVASLITELNTGRKPFDRDTVLIVDEASTLANRDHHALVRAIRDAGAITRTIGDPAQHRAVDAGGLWTQLLETHPDRVAHLHHNRRQTAPAMADVRRAGELLRNGRGSEAVQVLAQSNRLHTAVEASDLIADIVHDWHADYRNHLTERSAPSRMMAEHHTTRRLLNQAAQELLRADGTITGPGVLIGEANIHVGDEVITRTQNRDARGANGRFLRNGVVGTVVSVHSDEHGPTIQVRFPGFGTTTLHSEWLTQQVRHGLDGAIAPAYAITTHVAQGQTMEAGRAVLSEMTTPEAAYVALTRGRNDTRLYVLDSPVRTERQTAAEQAEFPILLDEPELLDAIAKRLQQKTAAEPATSIDRKALEVHRLSLLPIDQINKRIENRDAALGVAIHRAQLRALVNPPVTYLADYGPRPSADHPHQPIWDRAVAARSAHDALGGSAQAMSTDPTVSRLHREARAAALDRLHLGELISRYDVVDNRTHGRSDLDEAIERRVTNAIATPHDYLTDRLGTRPDDPELAAEWDRDASKVERARHRNGLEPSAGHAGLGATEVLGPKHADQEALTIETIPEQAQPRRRAPSLRR